MQRALTVTGVLGAGCAIVFAAAALASALFPNGTVVAANGWSNDVMMDRGVAVPVPAPAVMPVPENPNGFEQGVAPGGGVVVQGDGTVTGGDDAVDSGDAGGDTSGGDTVPIVDDSPVPTP